MKTLEQLKCMGLVSKTKQPSPYGDTAGYKVLRYDPRLGIYCFWENIYSKKEIENQKFQDDVFGTFDD
ncbi:MAG TPA: hypothetical protein VFM18_19795 [Methanosarcina sp.]|nr:hypothetical protein [Methanosarcina sp.]